MTVGQAKKLKIGDYVNFPSDRGNKAGKGKVVSVSEGINKNIDNVEYVWVGLENPCGVWPSNRLS